MDPQSPPITLASDSSSDTALAGRKHPLPVQDETNTPNKTSTTGKGKAEPHLKAYPGVGQVCPLSKETGRLLSAALLPGGFRATPLSCTLPSYAASSAPTEPSCLFCATVTHRRPASDVIPRGADKMYAGYPWKTTHTTVDGKSIWQMICPTIWTKAVSKLGSQSDLDVVATDLCATKKSARFQKRACNGFQD